MTATIRNAVPADAESCGRIIFEAFTAIAEQHRFPLDFPTAEAGTGLAAMFIADPSVFGVVAEIDGRVVGSNFLNEGDPVRAVGPISVAQSAQGGGVGRRLMEAVIERGRSAAGVRLVQDAFNTRSISLYASLGFEVREPLFLVSGTPRSSPDPEFRVRPMKDDDLGACGALCEKVHGTRRTHELSYGLRQFTPFVVERQGRITAYVSASGFWLMNHGVAETEEDMKAVILGAASMSSQPVAFLLPPRQARFFRWVLREGMRVIKPMTLMTIGEYREPRGCYFPSVLY